MTTQSMANTAVALLSFIPDPTRLCVVLPRDNGERTHIHTRTSVLLEKAEEGQGTGNLRSWAVWKHSVRVHPC